MTRTYPAIVNRLYAPTYSNRRGAESTSYYKKIGSRILLPTETIDWTWYGASDIVLLYRIEASFQFSLLDITKSNDYVACVSWITDGTTVHRYKLWQDVGEILYAPLYTGQYIGEDFLIEIWNVQLPHWGDTSSFTIEGFYLYSSNLVLQLSCCCEGDGAKFNAADGEVDFSPTILIEHDKTYDNIMPVDDSCCGFDFVAITTDATKTVIVRFPITSGDVTEVTLKAKSNSTDFSSMGLFEEIKGFLSMAGVTSVITDVKHFKGGTADASAIFLETDGANIIVSIQGLAGKTINWTLRVKVYPNFNSNPNVLPPPSPSPMLPVTVAYYKCDETSGAMVDATGLNTLVPQGVTVSGTSLGVINGSRVFSNSVPDFFGVVDAGHTALRFGPKTRTTTMWINITTIGSVQNVLWKNHEVLIYIDAAGKINFNMLKADNTVVAAVVSAVALTAGTFCFVVCKYDLPSQTVSVQINNGAIVLAAQTDIPGNGATANMLNIGSTGGINGFTGKLDEIGIFDANLTSDELNVLYSPTSYPFS